MRKLLDWIWPPHRRRVVIDTVAGYDLSDHVKIQYKCAKCSNTATADAKRVPGMFSFIRPEGWTTATIQSPGKPAAGYVFCPEHSFSPITDSEIKK